MLQVTEDTPPDMLAGAMDLAVHLPAGRSVKMSVERSTPMMDLLVQITTNQQLQLSNYTLQALGMAPSSDRGDQILPYKPNTPIGTLDTQHIKVIPKSRSLPVAKGAASGVQPFESTFRLKVHLPRNQLYVTRVSRNVLLEDIMKKVCEEKNLDPVKYEFKHPANLDEILDPKLTLSDYQITEIYVVSKGTVSLSQAFSSSDIMALRKEEERKQMHNKTGGGVFNLIFRRGKSSMGSGSISSDTRSISPTHSDDSRSVTPPGIQQPVLAPPPKKDPPPDRPKPPQRKRRPAPKPPQATDPARPTEVARRDSEDARRNSEDARRDSEDARRDSEDARTTAEDSRRSSESKRSVVSEVSELQTRRTDNGLVICHSRNSSDSSGYHEASVLSENCNTSLPRRPKSAFVGAGEAEKMSQLHSQSTTNLSKMASHSKSTTSLGMTGRKKKAAPPPPPAIRASNPSINLEASSPVVASQPTLPQEAAPCTSQNPFLARSNPIPLPRNKTRAPVPLPRSSNPENFENESGVELVSTAKVSDASSEDDVIETVIASSEELEGQNSVSSEENSRQLEEPIVCVKKLEKLQAQLSHNLFSSEAFKSDPKETSEALYSSSKPGAPPLAKLVDGAEDSAESSKQDASPEEAKKLPEVVGVIPKTPEKKTSQSKFDTFGKRRLQVLASLTASFEDESSTPSSGTSLTTTSGSLNYVDDFSDLDDSVFSRSERKRAPDQAVFNQLCGIHDLEVVELKKNQSASSLTSLKSLPGFVSGGMKKWNNLEYLDSESLASLGPSSNGGWVVGDSEPVSLASHQPLDSLPSSDILPDIEAKPFGSTDSGIAPEIPEKNEEEPFTAPTPPPPILDEDIAAKENAIAKATEEESSLETKLAPPAAADFADLDWHYQLPSPPKAFRDSSPVDQDSVVTSPELFEKLKTLEEVQSEKETATSAVSEEQPPLLATLSLENLERRKSLVYNRVLSGLKMAEEQETFSGSLTKFESTFAELQTNQQRHHVLPNFKISTYDRPKQKIKVFEDDTVRSGGDKPTEAKIALRRSPFGRSMESISVRKNSSGDESCRSGEEYDFARPGPRRFAPSSGVFRSESFCKENGRAAAKPVLRSKSHLTLDGAKYRVDRRGSKDEGVSRSDSLYDVSGLHSLGVMRLIQNKLNTPTSSMENLTLQEKSPKPLSKPEPPQKQPQTAPKPTVPEKIYKYSGPPAVNMSTWSERPKVPVSVAEDEDYTLGNNNPNLTSKLIVNTTNNSVSSNNSVEVRGGDPANGVSVTVNGREAAAPGNVVIKIGQPPKTIDNQRFIGHTTAVGYRKPFGSVGNQRPHSIAFDSDFDISRVPVVRAVELKKPYKELGTSVTHIHKEEPPKGKWQSPVVRGFQTNRDGSWTNRSSWSSFKDSFAPNSQVPFGQATLRRTDSNKFAERPCELRQENGGDLTASRPPPPPAMPKVALKKPAVKLAEPVPDHRDQLLSAIRNFGGKKGLRCVKG